MIPDVVLLVLIAWFVIFVSGGVFREYSPVPSDAFFRRMSRATWWLPPSLIACAGVVAAATSHVVGWRVVGVLVSVLTVALCWRWRPSRADSLKVPRWVAAIRAFVDSPIRDAAAWPRQALVVVMGAVLLFVTS